MANPAHPSRIYPERRGIVCSWCGVSIPKGMLWTFSREGGMVRWARVICPNCEHQTEVLARSA